ncbi:MAG: hypothetical protein CVU84_17550 [Firmicutes bacterium HGW-Firmicutes-1]|jgi:hypothetical protein|nr:MAG: hypothetical protein CVU84_17550 [Firmicutes bacterium HGW-Firmicutes-1]
MKVFTKLFMITIIVLSFSFTVGCSKTTVQLDEKVIELFMPKEEGVYVEKVGDNSMVVVRLNTDYGFKNYLEKGSSSIEEHLEYFEMAGIDFYDKAKEMRGPFCTTYSAQNVAGDYLYGRNCDYFSDDTAILLYTKPNDGYASVSMTDGVYFGYENENSNIEEIKKYMKAAAYFPVDGMNECGVAIASCSVLAKNKNELGKVSISSLNVIRLVLDYAKDVDEAVELMKKYNLYFELTDIVDQSHYMISDATGKSVIVEFVKGEMIVLNSNYPWQVNTNFVISNFEKEEDALGVCYRYKLAFNDLKEKKGVLKENEPMELLSDVSQEHTLYSTVYNKTSGDIQVAIRRKYESTYQFKIEMK